MIYRYVEQDVVGRPFVSHEPYHGGMYGDEEDERPTMGTNSANPLIKLIFYIISMDSYGSYR